MRYLGLGFGLVIGYFDCLQRNLDYVAYRLSFELQIEVRFWCRRRRRRRGGGTTVGDVGEDIGGGGFWGNWREGRKDLGGFLVKVMVVEATFGDL